MDHLSLDGVSLCLHLYVYSMSTSRASLNRADGLEGSPRMIPLRVAAARRREWPMTTMRPWNVDSSPNSAQRQSAETGRSTRGLTGSVPRRRQAAGSTGGGGESFLRPQARRIKFISFVTYDLFLFV